MESGIDVPGDGRGAAVADFDGDGRPDLCVAQHDGEMKLYRNERARPGIRVQLNGPASTVTLRAEFTDGSFGPAREIHFGSGWFSQDSVASILAVPKAVKAIEARWGNGPVTNTTVPFAATEVVVETKRK